MNNEALQDRAINEKWLERIESKDTTLWSSDSDVQEKISNRLGWLDSIDWLDDKLEGIYNVKDELLNDDINHVVLLGMGGSSLAPEVCHVIHNNIDKESDDSSLSFQMLDDTAPSAVRSVLDDIELEKTVFLVASKSGSTIETDAFFRYFYQQYDKSEAGSHFIAITDDGTEMAKTAEELNFRHSFINPSDIGGRFSALSYFGIVPAVFMGINVEDMLSGAKQEYVDVFKSHNPLPVALKAALHIGQWALSGKNKCFLRYSNEIKIMELWIDQLIAESTGKLLKGILPVSTSSSFQLTVDAFWVDVNFEETSNSIDLNIKDSVDTLSWSVSNWSDIGRDFLRWELITAVLGVVLQINPFDEPDVTVAKEKTRGILKNSDKANGLDKFKFSDLDKLNEKLSESVNSTDSAYIGIAIYGDAKSNIMESIETWQEKLHKAYQIAVVSNIGPRYLHSSGQLHKGGPAQGIFIIVTLGYGKDEEVPSKDFSFSTLNRAQALGDMSALNDRERPIIWLDFENSDEFINFLD